MNIDIDNLGPHFHIFPFPISVLSLVIYYFCSLHLCKSLTITLFFAHISPFYLLLGSFIPPSLTKKKPNPNMISGEKCMIYWS